MVRCDGKIHDQFSLDVLNGDLKYEMKPGQIAVLYRISLPEGADELFDEIMGESFLTDPPIAHMNSTGKSE